jgi:hypothetical protein
MRSDVHSVVSQVPPGAAGGAGGRTIFIAELSRGTYTAIKYAVVQIGVDSVIL